MRSAIVGAVLLAVGGVLIATGVLPLEDAAAVGERVWPILLFVVAITIVSELCAEAGVFAAIAHRAAEWGRGRTLVLWLLVVVIAVVTTVFLSLDTTAVLLTPVVVVLARHVGVPPLPFALTTVWLANTASLLLPVSNLTNLLAQHRLGGPSPIEFAALMALPALVAILVPGAVIAVLHRRMLVSRYHPDEPSVAVDPVLFRSSIVVLALLLPALVSGVDVWIPAVVAAIVLVVFFAVRRREVLRFSLVPWQLVVFAAGLFLVVDAANSLGLVRLVDAVAGSGEGFVDLLRLAGTSAAGANAINNLPAYLALEGVASSPHRMAALLIGVNAGSLITPWASLATMLWHSRLVGLGVEVSWWRYAALGAVVAPLTVVGAVAVLTLAP
ncbi:SLC13 family permease [Salinibacterium soli]|uniref:ArsB/NhaD family transporter n=1 Tax=Antiquaquibacter soli TaxID=3064523 RepID=A0ABT9BJN0_9MICO|nr:SLC13 family permease [Protaetiibacter sp. WY-16]MDO7881226.1 ArsB/NhaD family transporter [Protaetiibacter sp. WY-16]